jgi:hypothetical protein
LVFVRRSIEYGMVDDERDRSVEYDEFKAGAGLDIDGKLCK